MHLQDRPAPPAALLVEGTYHCVTGTGLLSEGVMSLVGAALLTPPLSFCACG